MEPFASIPSRLSFWWSDYRLSSSVGGPSAVPSLGRNRPRFVLHLLLVLPGAAVWIWTEASGHAGDGYASDYHAQYLLGLTSLATALTVALCRIADLVTPKQLDLLRVRLEFSLFAFLSFVWFSLTVALTQYTLHLWPDTPVPSASNPPHWSSPPLGRSFVTTTLFISSFFQTATFVLACSLLSVAVARLRTTPSGGLSGQGNSSPSDADRWVMWDLSSAGTDEESGAATQQSRLARGYGAVDEAGRVGSLAPPSVKQGREGKEVDRQRSYFWVLGLLALGGVLGSAGWMLFGYETDAADIALIVLNALTLWISACYLFLPSHLTPKLPSLLSSLAPLLPLALYPIPTILFTLPPIPSAPPASESQPPPPPPPDLSHFERTVTYTPSLAIACGWAVQVFVVFWVASRWMPKEGAVGGVGGERADLFFPGSATAAPRREEEEALLGSPSSPRTTRFGRWGRGRMTGRDDPDRMREFEIEEREVLDGEGDGEEVVRLMSPAPGRSER